VNEKEKGMNEWKHVYNELVETMWPVKRLGD
jgi:hypothetical protein